MGRERVTYDHDFRIVYACFISPKIGGRSWGAHIPRAAVVVYTAEVAMLMPTMERM